MKYKVSYLLIVSCLFLTSCSQSKEIQNNWEQNKVCKWNDYYKNAERPYEDFELEMTLEDFPDVTFKWTEFSVTAIENGNKKGMIAGMPVYSIYFTDLTNDGFPEICSTVMFGSGIIDTHIEVFDYKNDKNYTLCERTLYDYNLIMKDDKLLVEKRPYGYYEDDRVETGNLIIEDDILKFIQ
ncbi:MAG: hypothetical protein K2K91_04505 [Ruminococcus sp.]|nr:hypothetical protein [Ruminococcus sp.]